jgi:CheY-like chemotaxis protein
MSQLLKAESLASAPERMSILVAEDEVPVRAFTSRVLRAEGFVVLESGNGEEAMHVSGRHMGRIKPLVTDVWMRRLGGHELAHRLAEQRPWLRVLFLTGDPDGAIAEFGNASGTAAILGKPFSTAELVHKVREVLR